MSNKCACVDFVIKEKEPGVPTSYCVVRPDSDGRHIPVVIRDDEDRNMSSDGRRTIIFEGEYACLAERQSFEALCKRYAPQILGQEEYLSVAGQEAASLVQGAARGMFSPFRLLWS